MMQIHLEQECLILAPGGYFDQEQVDQCRPAMKEALAKGVPEIRFDLSGAAHVSSTALGFMIEAWKRAHESGVKVRIYSPNSSVLAVLRQTRLDKLLVHQDGGSENMTPPDLDTNDEVAVLEHVTEAMARDLRLLGRLNKVLAAILPLRDRQQIGRMVLEGILEALDFERGAFFLLTQDGTELELLHSIGLSGDQARTCERLLLDPGSPEAKTLEPRSCGVRTVSLETCSSALLSALGFPSAIFAPAASEQNPFGLLAIDLPEGSQPLVDAAGPLVESFAGVCGLAMQNSVLVADLNRRNKRIEQTLLELTLAQAALNDSSKLATLGALISGLGHSLNNRLAPILGYAQMFVRKYKDDEKTGRQMQLIERSALELKDILERLVSITRGKPPQYRPDSLNETIESALALSEPSLKAEGVEVESSLAPDLPELNLDRQLMIQGFLSIFHRAQSTYPPHATGKYLRISSVREGTIAVVRIVDNGLPLSEENLADIVDPLKPLQRVGYVDVFNLSIPCSIVQKHGGQFKVSDMDGQGTAIEIRIAPEAVLASAKNQMIG